MKHVIQIVTALAMLGAPSAYAATIEMNINGLVCAFCAQGIEKKLRKALTQAGYTVTSIQRTDTPIDAVRFRVKQAKP